MTLVDFGSPILGLLVFQSFHFELKKIILDIRRDHQLFLLVYFVLVCCTLFFVYFVHVCCTLFCVYFVHVCCTLFCVYVVHVCCTLFVLCVFCTCVLYIVCFV